MQHVTHVRSYRSWNLREASIRAAEAQSQNTLLISHEVQLQNIASVVQAGHANILAQLGNTKRHDMDKSSDDTSITSHTSRALVSWKSTKRSSARTLRLALPRWLSHHVWEFAAQEVDGAWNFRVRPVNVRPFGTFAFDVVRSGDVEAVRKLLTSGELSV